MSLSCMPSVLKDSIFPIVKACFEDPSARNGLVFEMDTSSRDEDFVAKHFSDYCRFAQNIVSPSVNVEGYNRLKTLVSLA